MINLLNTLRSYGTKETKIPVFRMPAWLWRMDSSFDTGQPTAAKTVKSILLLTRLLTEQ